MEAKDQNEEARISPSSSSLASVVAEGRRTPPQTLIQNHLQYPLRSRIDPPEPNPVRSPAAGPARYGECLKNHAARTGGYILDGCGEFMARRADGSPESFKCAACDCHRSFHRREEPAAPNHRLISGFPASQAAQAAPMMVAFGGAPDESSSEDLELYRAGEPAAVQPKKRFRTKFSEEQKMKMMDFAKKIGWKIQKKDEEEVQRFCSEVGVNRRVFKVWMHNNKQVAKNSS